MAGLVLDARADYDISVFVGDAVVNSGQQQVPISVYMNNVTDSVAAFSMILKSSNYSIATFAIDTAQRVDTTYWDCLNPPTCTDTVQVGAGGTWDFRHIDTALIANGVINAAGSPVQGWELKSAWSEIITGREMKFTGLADQTPPYNNPPIAKGYSGLLFTTYINIKQVPETATVRQSQIFTERFLLGVWPVFSRPNGTAIGVNLVTEQRIDCWECEQWIGSNCINWIRYGIPPNPPCDSLDTVDVIVPRFDTTKFQCVDGTVTVLPGCCQGPIRGNLDGDPGDLTDPSDLQTIVDYIFFNINGLSSCDTENDVSGDEIVDPSDLQALIDYIFFGLESSILPCP